MMVTAVYMNGDELRSDAAISDYYSLTPYYAASKEWDREGRTLRKMIVQLRDVITAMEANRKSSMHEMKSTAKTVNVWTYVTCGGYALFRFLLLVCGGCMAAVVLCALYSCLSLFRAVFCVWCCRIHCEWLERSAPPFVGRAVAGALVSVRGPLTPTVPSRPPHGLPVCTTATLPLLIPVSPAVVLPSRASS
jgi:hypothetical protein